jgi:hypothetical protein
MKKPSRTTTPVLACVAAAVLLSLAASPARADDPMYPPDADNPLRIVHYFVQPVGRFLEWTVTRPLAALAFHVAPYEHIDSKGFKGCSRERPARSCTYSVK